MMKCAMCGKNADCNHHLLFGNSIRRLADEDYIYIPLCNECHNMAVDAKQRIHGNMAAERLSKMLGQMMWEKDHICEYGECVRDKFIERYGRSYL